MSEAAVMRIRRLWQWTSGRAQALQARFENRWAKALPYVLALAAVGMVLVYGHKFWVTNDDSHMAMIAHGYGMTDTPSPGIVYSNVIWGWIVMHLSMGGIQGYTLGALAALVLSCLALGLALYRSQVPAWAGAALLVMMFCPSLMNMQFTINAGCLAVAALAVALAARLADGPWPWVAAVALLLLSALIRLDETLFMLLLSAPFWVMRWQQAMDRTLQRRAMMALAAAALAIGAASVVNHAYYSGSEWASFRQMNALRRPFTDYGLSQYYSKYRGRLRGSGVTVSDMHLMDERAFLDTDFFTPERLKPLMRDVSLHERVDFNLARWREALKPFQSLSLCAPLLVLALALLAGRRRKAPLAASLLLLGAMLFFWLWGRPGIIHVYQPAEAALAAFALLGMEWRPRLLLALGGAVLFALALSFTLRLYHTTRNESAHAAKQVRAACQLPSDQLWVVWGPPALNERHLYRPLSPPGGECPLQLYFINTLSLLPGTLDKLYGYTHGKGLIQALRDGQPFHVLSDATRLAMLQNYFKAHYGLVLTAKPLDLDTSTHGYLLQVTP